MPSPAADERVVVVGDAHLGSAGPADETAFHAFLDAVPRMGNRLLIMGDLFDFWFEYRSVIPRRPLRTLAHLARLVEQGVQVDIMGGNHDRWGGSFWTELGVRFRAEGLDTELAGRTAWVHHGDGLAEQKLGGKLIHRLTRSPIAVRGFRMIHPDLGFRIVQRLSWALGEANRTPEAIATWAAAQERYAREVLARRPELRLVLMAHTHRQCLVEVDAGRFYLNAGQWMADRHYAVITAGEILISRWA